MSNCHDYYHLIDNAIIIVLKNIFFAIYFSQYIAKNNPIILHLILLSGIDISPYVVDLVLFANSSKNINLVDYIFGQNTLAMNVEDFFPLPLKDTALDKSLSKYRKITTI